MNSCSAHPGTHEKRPDVTGRGGVASREAQSYDLWACALVQHAYVGMAARQHKEAAGVLSAAERIANQGDSALSTRHWVASVQAEAYAGTGQLTSCERALGEAEKVADHSGAATTSGWLRFDGSRLAEERGARYVELGRLDLAEAALTHALKEGALANGQSFRRRGAAGAVHDQVGRFLARE